MMIDSKIYKGIEYVQLNELPQTQREKITETLNRDLIIKIMINGTIIGDCLQFKDYTFWYNSVYRPKQTTSLDRTAPVEVALEAVAIKQN